MEGNHIHRCICVTLFRLLGVKCAYVHVLIVGYVTGYHDVVGSGPDYTITTGAKVTAKSEASKHESSLGSEKR